ncbi:RND family efflux transporter, MFP subunit [Paraburkholderia fungorum]|uniref:RND family efflux transporter, MFP subunit n=1 Tax=Paraburkholderia fungorum TaxID=134537 RepID=A0A1H1JZN2_9BURK|nr:RND family efflux transporter, MFP subunit [Paraburkholderia fungorum]
MWIVKLALTRPHTFIVMAIGILLATPFVLLTMPTDVFPSIDIPVISIIWSYSGLSASDVATRITAVNERGLTTTVSNIQHIESESLPGISVIKLFLQPRASVETAIAQTAALEQFELRQMPPGATPPLIITYSASSIPAIQLGLSSRSMTEQAVADVALNFLRPQLVTIPGAQVPVPYGGKTRVASVDLDSRALLEKGLTPTDIVNAVTAQNLILPTGTAKIGQTEYTFGMNGSPATIEALNNIPVRTLNGATTYLREVAHVRDGFSPQTNIVRQDGVRGVLVTLLKSGDASTLEVVKSLKALLPHVSEALPQDFKITPLFDQSVFVSASINGVIREALIAAGLTAVMILLFLGNWRSTLIIAVSIPLSIFSSLIVLHALGETINIMTLGGLALAVGILVDDATVTIENIERHLHLGSSLETAILEGAGEIATPALVSTLCICIVFVPMFFLGGVARYLFVPLAEAVAFAMIASYLLSRTLVPTLAFLLMRHVRPVQEKLDESVFAKVHQRFNAGFESVRRNYVVILGILLARRRIFAAAFLGFCIASTALILVLGRDFFPSVDGDGIRLHMRAPSGFRIEETARLADKVEKVVREVIPQSELDTILDNLGLPYSGINLSYSNAGTIGSLDGEIQIALKPGHLSTRSYVARLRTVLPERFPGVEFFFQPADMVTQILNFGQPAAIDVQVVGSNLVSDMSIASHLMKDIRRIPGTVDAHIQQRNNEPAFLMNMDRTRLQQVGLTANTVARNLLISLSGSSQTSPSFWVNPQNGVEYPLSVQTPQYDLATIDDILRMPVSPDANVAPQLLGNLAVPQPGVQPAIVTHYNIRPAIDLYVSVEGRDLGSVAAEIDRLVDKARASLPRGTDLVVRGQVETMRSSFVGLGVGVAVAVVLVYLLMVINFQSWIDPLIIISGLPAAIAGIIWMLFATRTHLSVPALTGAIMTVGVATANSILVVAFARERLMSGATPLRAALDAGATRVRPVLMTAAAMIIGMIPMALGFGEGAEQNAPLGRAVIGGLLFATASTLLFVPVMFAGIHSRLRRKHRTGLSNELSGDPRRQIGPDGETLEPNGHSSATSVNAIDAQHVDDSLPPQRLVVRRLKIGVVVVIFVLAGAAVRAVSENIHDSRNVANITARNSLQYVSVIVPSTSTDNISINLPGTIRGAVESPIFARATGYVLHRYVDIGERVKPGQLLADLDTPEVDQELNQAVAQRSQLTSSLSLARSSFERWQKLRQHDDVSQQALDERKNSFDQNVANLAAADANVRRLQQLESFKRVEAPFSGVVTQRNVDVGDLVEAGSGRQALFGMAQPELLRVYVQLPQAYVQNVREGEEVTVTQPELGGQQFHGFVSHVSGAIDVPTRSLQLEVSLSNPGNVLRPGAYVEVSLATATRAPLLVPSSALLFRANGPRLAVVGHDGKVRLQRIVIARDLGESLEVTSGIKASDKVIANPSDFIEDGDGVVVKSPPFVNGLHS